MPQRQESRKRQVRRALQTVRMEKPEVQKGVRRRMTSKVKMDRRLEEEKDE